MTVNNKNGDTVVIRVVCAVAFLVFTFGYLYFYQCDLIGAVQHVLSGGQTSYSRLVGTIIITVVLYLLQIGIYALTKLNRHAHALTYFPSLLLLSLLTAVEDSFDRSFSLSTWAWFSPVLLILFVFIVYLSMKYHPYMQKKSYVGIFSEASWTNMLTMALMFVFVGVFGNGNDVLHYRLRIERCLSEKDYATALTIGKSSLETDSSLFMLRASALARSKQLGERLFEYPTIGGSASLLPNHGSVRCVLYDAGDVYRVVGAIPKSKMTVSDYLKTIKQTGQTRAAYGDYLLCSYLLDRNLDKFASELGEYYVIDSVSVLPKHYREALVLYERQRSVEYEGFHDEVAEADYEDMMEIRRKYRNMPEYLTKLRDSYGKTYWYYFFKE
ncbi:MAG: DUF6057 family protein [Prevotella sp.]|uniref:DUF6057 family protein n=1 Tax=Prevotella sp. TaxID=59823 RepID=UPI002A2F90CE|nr:DUF6057 family protein [Prevotella sp.]MDD7318228.1 DUF6057 family protein [Prevotellaceae bacterium]MDY4020883.1 DUF6057 family protein [Prevotella sp.]